MLRPLAIFATLGALGLVPLRAQTTTSTLAGVVRDAEGRPREGVLVRATSRATNAVRSAISEGEGVFRIELLQPGTWIVVAADQQGRRSEARLVELGLQQTVWVELVLREQVAERVVVTAEPPLLDPQRTGGELRIGQLQSEALPLAGRVATDLALLDPAVRPAPPGNFYGERGSVFVVHGQSGRSNAFLVDGLDNNDQTSGTTLNAFFSQQVIQEFVVLTSAYAPEFGRASGAVVNIVTQRGGNTPGGGAFVQGSFKNLNSGGPLAESLPLPPGVTAALGRWQTGLRLHGPLRRDRAFYFFAFEHQSSDDVLPFTGVQRDRTRGGVFVAPARDDNVFFRTDFEFKPNHTLMVRISADDRSTEGLNVGGVTTPEAGFRLEERDFQWAAAWTAILSPRRMNELRVLLGASRFDQFANSSRPGVARPSGVFGGNNLNLQRRDEDRVQLVENFTWRRGSHTLKLGLDVARSRTRLDVRFNPNGNFLYASDAPFEPGDGFDLFAGEDCVDATSEDVVPCPGEPGVDDDGDGLVDEPALRETYPLVMTLIEGAPQATLRDTRLSFFVQDRWQASSRWVVDYGLRYDLSTFRLPPEARVATFIPNGGAGRDTNNLAPRFSFSYRRANEARWLVRGGAGVFYDKLVLAFPAVAAVTSQTRIGLLLAQGFGFEVTEDLVEALGIEPLKELLVFPEAFVLRFSTGTRLDTPYTVQANVAFERAAGRRGAWRVNLLRAQGYHLPLMRDLNPVVCVLNQGKDSVLDPCARADTPEDLEDPRRIPVHLDTNTGSIAAVVTEGRSWYTGLDLAYQWRGDDGWFSAGYTFSRAEDLGPDPLTGGVYLPADSANLARERARADSDRRHRLALGWDTSIGGGFRASGLLQVASGAPFNVTTGRDDNLDGIATDRPPGVPRNSGGATPLEPVNRIRQEEGLPPVGALHEPSLVQLDLRVGRPFSIERASAELFVQVFNLLDRFNGGPIEGRVTSADFGRAIGQTGPPRTVEFGLKFAW